MLTKSMDAGVLSPTASILVDTPASRGSTRPTPSSNNDAKNLYDELEHEGHGGRAARPFAMSIHAVPQGAVRPQGLTPSCFWILLNLIQYGVYATALWWFFGATTSTYADLRADVDGTEEDEIYLEDEEEDFEALAKTPTLRALPRRPPPRPRARRPRRRRRPLRLRRPEPRARPPGEPSPRASDGRPPRGAGRRRSPPVPPPVPPIRVRHRSAGPPPSEAESAKGAAGATRRPRNRALEVPPRDPDVRGLTAPSPAPTQPLPPARPARVHEHPLGEEVRLASSRAAPSGA